jgi:hypothetical protein
VKALKLLVIGMGILILFGTTGLGILLYKKLEVSTIDTSEAKETVVLLPEESHILEMQTSDKKIFLRVSEKTDGQQSIIIIDQSNFSDVKRIFLKGLKH